MTTFETTIVVVLLASVALALISTIYLFYTAHSYLEKGKQQGNEFLENFAIFSLKLTCFVLAVLCVVLVVVFFFHPESLMMGSSSLTDP